MLGKHNRPGNAEMTQGWHGNGLYTQKNNNGEARNWQIYRLSLGKSGQDSGQEAETLLLRHNWRQWKQLKSKFANISSTRKATGRSWKSWCNVVRNLCESEWVDGLELLKVSMLMHVVMDTS